MVGVQWCAGLCSNPTLPTNLFAKCIYHIGVFVILVPMDASKVVLKEVADEYESSLTIPSEKSMPQWMLMPVGLIGAGKTTVVKPLAERFGLIRLSTDEIRELLNKRGYSYQGCKEIIIGLAKKYLDQGYSLAIDANTGSKEGLEYSAKSTKAYPNVRQIFIYINPPEKFITEKLKKYNHTWLFTDGEEAVKSYYKNREAFTLPDLAFVFEFDTSRENLEEQINEAVININSALK